MNPDANKSTSDERYVFEERLGILGVIGRDPTPQERRMALEDVEIYRQYIKPEHLGFPLEEPYSFI